MVTDCCGEDVGLAILVDPYDWMFGVAIVAFGENGSGWIELVDVVEFAFWSVPLCSSWFVGGVLGVSGCDFDSWTLRTVAGGNYSE